MKQIFSSLVTCVSGLNNRLMFSLYDSTGGVRRQDDRLVSDFSFSYHLQVVAVIIAELQHDESSMFE